MQEKMDKLRQILGEVSDLEKAAAVLDWDQETYMPEGGVNARSEQLGTLSRLAHERFTSDEVGALLDAVADYAAALDYDSDDASLVRVTRRLYDKSRRVPSELVAEISRAGSLARPAWQQARRDADFSIFAPYLEKNVELSRQLADALGHDGSPYDALLDYSEPGVTSAQLAAIFSTLKEAIVPLVRQIAARQDRVDSSVVAGEVDEQKQLDFSMRVVQEFGYSLERGRLDLSAHPFCTSFSPNDVRITARVHRGSLADTLYDILHEGGHAMYEQGISTDLQRTPLCDGASPGVHESQSRLWENLIGRSRPFWQHYLPQLQQLFPEKFGPLDLETVYRAVNKVEPSLIRIDADEVTYNLHILLRFELESALLDGSLKVADLPAAWDAKMEEYLGIRPPSVSDGALQDIHWTGAWMASFPGYTLGNIIGAQLLDQARADLGDLDAQIAAGNFAPLHTWLVRNLYRHGTKFTPNELVERITGKPLNTDAWVRYVQEKFADVYGLDAS